MLVDSVQICGPARRPFAGVPPWPVQIFVTKLRQPIGAPRVLVSVDHSVAKLECASLRRWRALSGSKRGTGGALHDYAVGV